MAYTRPEPLRGKNCTEGFSCGEPELDTWIDSYARHAEAAGTARTFVTTAGDEQVVGFYALAASSVAPHDATERLMKGLPARRPVPVIVLTRLGVDERHQGSGVGRSLMQDAVLRCHQVADDIGARALIVHALTERARSWYLQYGFEPSPTDRLHLALLMKDLRKLIDAAQDA